MSKKDMTFTFVIVRINKKQALKTSIHVMPLTFPPSPAFPFLSLSGFSLLLLLLPATYQASSD